MNGLSRTNGQSNPLQPICAPMYGKYTVHVQPSNSGRTVTAKDKIDSDLLANK